MSRKSDYIILDVLDKSENSNDQMIDIMNHVHENYVPYLPNAVGDNTVERIVFGGDQLTNERAFSAQLNMLNGTNSSSRLMGVSHRTEGLHLCMNTCLYILETFYSSSSVRDAGTLYQLKTLVDRRNIQFDMTNGYNLAKNFVDDVLDSHVIASALEFFGMSDLDCYPTTNQLPQNLEKASDDDQLEFVSRVASEIVDKFVLHAQQLQISEELEVLDDFQSNMLQKHAGKFCCHVTGCSKVYASAGWLKNHLKKVHNINIKAISARSSEPEHSFDGVNNYATAFMKVALLFRDTRDAFKMGDGDRLFRNIKFLMLHFGQSSHVKYRLWLWRMLAYDQALLSEYERYSYRWNLAINMTGGVRRCIANDNLVEIHVHKIKDLMRSMGANLSYNAVRCASKCLGTVQSLTDELGTRVSGKHADFTTHKVRDIKEMSACLRQNHNLEHVPRREHANYPNISGDLLSSVDLVKLNDWIHTQKLRASREMQFQ